MTNQPYAEETVDDLLVNVIDETLKRVFKDAGTKAIYDCLENNSHLKREEIAENPEVFSAVFQKLLDSAAPVIENLILKDLHLKLGLKFRKKKGYQFSDYLQELKEKCEC